MQEEDIQRILDEIKEVREIAEENRRILRKINRARIRGYIFNFLKWIIIISISLGIYYYIEPYLISLKEFFQNIQNLPKLPSGLDLFSTFY